MSLSIRDKLALRILGSEWPTAKGYTIKDGFISGHEIRCEAFNEDEIWINETNLPPGISACVPPSGQRWDGCGFVLKNCPPFERDGKTWSVSPIQKKSYHGWLTCFPDAYWYWNMSKLQDSAIYDYYGTPKIIWKEGTEQGILLRKGTVLLQPACWRVDFASTEIDGINRYWIPSWGHFGRRYD